MQEIQAICLIFEILTFQQVKQKCFHDLTNTISKGISCCFLWDLISHENFNFPCNAWSLKWIRSTQDYKIWRINIKGKGECESICWLVLVLWVKQLGRKMQIVHLEILRFVFCSRVIYILPATLVTHLERAEGSLATKGI